MNDAIYSYLKKRLVASLDRSKWDDQVGKLFSQNIMPDLVKSIDALQGIVFDVEDFLKKAEEELQIE